MKKSCLDCSKWVSCSYLKKSGSYSCSEFSEQSSVLPIDFLTNLDSVVFQSSKEEDKFYKDKELQLSDMLENYLDAKVPVPKDLKVDDGHIPAMPNFYSFCFDEKWGFKDIKPFARQLWIGLKVFCEICPRCTKKKYFQSLYSIRVGYKPEKILKKLTLLEFGVCPKCNARKSDMVKSGELIIYTELAHISGQRSGKSIATSFYITYLVHQILKLQKPADLFLGVPNQFLVGTVVAPNFKDCITLLWRPILDAMADSPWFDAYHELMKECNKKYGIEGFKMKDTFLEYGFRKLLLAPQAANLRTLRGKSRVLYSADELDYFSADEDSKSKITVSGMGIYDALNTSMSTVQQSSYSLLMKGYDNIPTAIAFNISSPCISPGVLSQLIAKPIEGTLALRTPTWEINPKMPKDSPAIKRAYSIDALQAETNYGANPPTSGSPFISKSFKLINLFSGIKNRITYQYEHKIDNFDGIERLYKYAKIVGMNTANYDVGSVLSMDAGFSNNSLAVTICRKGKDKIIFDVNVEVAPEIGKSVLHYPLLVEDLIKPLIKEFNVKIVLADRWQSLFLLQKLAMDCPDVKLCKQYSVKYSDFLLYKSYITGNGIEFAKLELEEQECITISSNYQSYFEYKPMSHLYHQLITVQDKGHSVDKGIDRTDDIVRAQVLGFTFLVDSKNEKLLEHVQKSRSNKNRAIISDGSSASASGVVKGKNGKGLIASNF